MGACRGKSNLISSLLSFLPHAPLSRKSPSPPCANHSTGHDLSSLSSQQPVMASSLSGQQPVTAHGLLPLQSATSNCSWPLLPLQPASSNCSKPPPFPVSLSWQATLFPPLSWLSR
ncbi:hypothetical protein WN943_004300 [Citrus x changshan-huyou]